MLPTVIVPAAPQAAMAIPLNPAVITPNPSLAARNLLFHAITANHPTAKAQPYVKPDSYAPPSRRSPADVNREAGSESDREESANASLKSGLPSAFAAQLIAQGNDLAFFQTSASDENITAPVAENAQPFMRRAGYEPSLVRLRGSQAYLASFTRNQLLLVPASIPQSDVTI